MIRYNKIYFNILGHFFCNWLHQDMNTLQFYCRRSFRWVPNLEFITFFASFACSQLSYSIKILPIPGTEKPCIGLGIFMDSTFPYLEHSFYMSSWSSLNSSSTSSWIYYIFILYSFYGNFMEIIDKFYINFN